MNNRYSVTLLHRETGEPRIFVVALDPLTLEFMRRNKHHPNRVGGPTGPIARAGAISCAEKIAPAEFRPTINNIDAVAVEPIASLQ